MKFLGIIGLLIIVTAITLAVTQPKFLGNIEVFQMFRPKNATDDETIKARPTKTRPPVNSSIAVFHDVLWLEKAPGAGRPILLLFFATWSPPSLDYIKDMTVWEVTYREKELQVVGLSSEPIATLQKLKDSRVMTMILGQDTDGALAKKFKVEKVPRAVLFDADGKVVWEGIPTSLHEGIIDEAFPPVPSLQNH